MRPFLTLRKMLLLLPLLALPSALTNAQSPQAALSPDELFRTISSLDTTIFNMYNTCDLANFGNYFSDDVEFYHDQSGLSVGKESLIDALKKNICGKVTRELVSGTLEVYPLNGYGAVEIGVHRFHHPGHDDTEALGEAKFIHLWQHKDGAWKITRVISYDHHAMAK